LATVGDTHDSSPVSFTIESLGTRVGEGLSALLADEDAVGDAYRGLHDHGSAANNEAAADGAAFMSHWLTDGADCVDSDDGNIGTTNSSADTASRCTASVGNIPVPPLPPPVARSIDIVMLSSTAEKLRAEDERATVGGELVPLVDGQRLDVWLRCHAARRRRGRCATEQIWARTSAGHIILRRARGKRRGIQRPLDASAAAWHAVRR